MPGELAPGDAAPMPRGAPGNVMAAHEVSRAVNSVKGDGPELIELA